MTIGAHQGITLGVGLGLLVCYIGITFHKIVPNVPKADVTQLRASDSSKSLASIDIQRGGNTSAANPGNKDELLVTPGGRRLADNQIRTLGNRLSAFALQRFWIVAETGVYAPQSAQMTLSRQLQDALLSARWIQSQKVLQRIGTAGFKETSMEPYSRGGDTGVVLFAAPDSMAAGGALNTQLSGMSIRSSLEQDDNLKRAILIFVGTQ